MKRAIAALVGTLSLMVMAGAAFAGTVSVDFTGQPTTDITIDPGINIGNVNIFYQTYSTDAWANVSSSGIIGDTEGSLQFNFPDGATGLQFHYTTSAPPAEDFPFLLTYFSSAGGFDTVGILTLTDGELKYSGGIFNQAAIWFFPFPDTNQRYTFTVDNISYDPAISSVSALASTPLPAALPLFATGLGALGLLGWRRKRKTAAA